MFFPVFTPESSKGSGVFGIFNRLLPLFLFAFVCVFILYPVLKLIHTSFIMEGTYSFSQYFSVKNGFNLLSNSVISSFLSSVASTLFAVAVSLKITTSSPRIQSIFMVLLLLTMVSPPFIGSLAYIQLYGRRGWITNGLLGLSLNPYNMWGVVFMQTLSFTSLSVLFLIGIINKTDKRLLAAARDLGASPTKAFLTVFMPLIQPGIWACLLLSFIRGLADFGTPIVIGGRFNTVASQIYMEVTGYANISGAATLNMLIFIPSVLFFLIYRKFIAQSEKMLANLGGQSADLTGTYSLRGVVKYLSSFVCALFFIVLSLQYICVFAGGFIKNTALGYVFTMDHLERVLTYDASSLVRSVVYALCVGFMCTVFSILFAYYIERRKIKYGKIWDFIITIPMMIPGACFGIAYILAFNSFPLKLTGTAFIVIICMIARQLPASTKLCSASLSQVPYALEDAAADLGASRLRIIIDVIFKNLKPAFFTCFVYNFTGAMTTAGAILFLIVPSQKVAVFRLFDAVNSGDYGVASIISAFIILVSLAVSLGIKLITKENIERRLGDVPAATQSM